MNRAQRRKQQAEQRKSKKRDQKLGADKKRAEVMEENYLSSDPSIYNSAIVLTFLNTDDERLISKLKDNFKVLPVIIYEQNALGEIVSVKMSHSGEDLTELFRKCWREFETQLMNERGNSTVPREIKLTETIKVMNFFAEKELESEICHLVLSKVDDDQLVEWAINISNHWDCVHSEFRGLDLKVYGEQPEKSESGKTWH